MEKEINVKKKVVIKTLHVAAHVRYWEDATINGVDDEDGSLTPCKEGEMWKPVIDLDTGKILNWEQGKKADIHFKVCDSGSYFIKDTDGKTVLSIEEDYVPDILCPKGEGYGDYIIMDIDENGQIADWKLTLEGFESEDSEDDE